jgi:hypothetical protein
MAFDSSHRDAVAAGDVVLTNYSIVVWGAGNQLSNIFNSTAQTYLAAFLDGGGNLFVSGSQIGWSLGRSSGPTAADRAFLNNQLHCTLTSDANTNSGSYTVIPVSGSILDGKDNALFDNGTRGIYWVRHPDVLTPFGPGATALLNYSGGSPAAIAYDGSGGGGKVVVFGFPFETISSASVRHGYMAGILDFFTPPEPPRFVDVRVPAPGELRIVLTGRPGNPISLWHSDDFVTWQWHTNLPNPTGTAVFMDSTSPDRPRRFYRAEASP